PRDTPRAGWPAEGGLSSNNVSRVEAIIAWTVCAVLVMGGVADAGSGAAALRGSGRCVGNVITLLSNAAARRTMRSPKNEQQPISRKIWQPSWIMASSIRIVMLGSRTADHNRAWYESVPSSLRAAAAE